MTNTRQSSDRSISHLTPVRRPRAIVWLMLLVFFVVGAWSASRWLRWQTASANADLNPSVVRPMPVDVRTVEYVSNIKKSRTYTGTVQAKNRSDLGFETSGKIAEVFVEEGDAVAKGQPLAKLDTETLRAQKNAIQAGIEQSESLLAELQSGPREETIKAARSARDAARSQFDMSQSSLERRKSLFDQGAISSEEFDTVRFGLQTAEANLQSADQQLSELESGTRKEQLDAQSSALQQRLATMQEIEVAISKSTLFAPFAGTITQRYLDPGSIAQPSTAIVRLVAEHELECWIGLPVDIVAELNIGDEREVFVSNQSFAATVTAKIKELDTLTRTQTVLLKLAPDAAHKVVSGQLCELKIDSQTAAAGFWVPTTALSKGIRGLWSVLAVVSDSTGKCRVEKRDVEILHTESGRVLVRGTLEASDRIVIDGVHRIASGQLVEPLEQ